MKSIFYSTFKRR